MTKIDVLVASLVVLGVGILIIAIAAWRKHQYQRRWDKIVLNSGGVRR